MDEDQYIERFARRLCALRTQRGQSARDLSLSLGCAANYVNCIESCKNYPSMKNFFYLCDCLGITPKEFFSDDDDPRLADDLYREIDKLDANAKTYLLGLARQMNNKPE